jgi:hypothetical protein
LWGILVGRSRALVYLKYRGSVYIKEGMWRNHNTPVFKPGIHGLPRSPKADLDASYEPGRTHVRL